MIDVFASTNFKHIYHLLTLISDIKFPIFFSQHLYISYFLKKISWFFHVNITSCYGHWFWTKLWGFSKEFRMFDFYEAWQKYFCVFHALKRKWGKDNSWWILLLRIWCKKMKPIKYLIKCKSAKSDRMSALYADFTFSWWYYDNLFFKHGFILFVCCCFSSER